MPRSHNLGLRLPRKQLSFGYLGSNPSRGVFIMKKEKESAEIMYMFRYYYHSTWAPGHIFDGKSRLWIQAFNDLIKQGFIKRKKTEHGFNYKWVGQFPEGY